LSQSIAKPSPFVTLKFVEFKLTVGFAVGETQANFVGKPFA